MNERERVRLRTLLKRYNREDYSKLDINSKEELFHYRFKNQLTPSEIKEMWDLEEKQCAELFVERKISPSERLLSKLATSHPIKLNLDFSPTTRARKERACIPIVPHPDSYIKCEIDLYHYKVFGTTDISLIKKSI